MLKEVYPRCVSTIDSLKTASKFSYLREDESLDNECVDDHFKLELFFKNYRLDFLRYSKFWGGPTATLVATANCHVWGVIWRLHSENMADLDEQEGVHNKLYYETYLKVVTPYVGPFTCRVYVQKINPLPRGDNDPIPVEQWPSWTYKEVIIIGALEHQLPEYYIHALEKIKHNEERGCFKMFCLLRRFSRDKPCECRVPGRIPRQPLKLDLKLNRKKRKKIHH